MITVSRRKGEIQRKRVELLEKTHAEIDSLVTSYHAQLAEQDAVAVGALYARYSTRFQDSIADQVRSLLEEALRQKIFIPREYVFFDLATRGCTSRRPGLDALRQGLADQRLRVLLVFATNRLFRKNYKALQFVEEENRGARKTLYLPAAQESTLRTVIAGART